MGKPAGRRSIWEQTPGNETDGLPETTPQGSGEPRAPTAVPVVEQLRLAEKKTRNRAWERNNPVFLLRGIPQGLHEEIKRIAGELRITVSDVARAFLEYGLLCYQRGDLQVKPVLGNQRLTLFPDEDGWGSKRPGWYEEDWNQKPPVFRSQKSKASKDTAPKAWRQQVAYRGIPEDVQASIRSIHRRHYVPLGEIATLLLGTALQSYRDGRLVLHPQPLRTSRLDYESEE